MKPEDIKTAKAALESLDLQLLSKASEVNHQIADEIKKKLGEGEAETETLGSLSKTWVNTSRVYTSHASLAAERDGTGHQVGHQATVEGVIAMLLAKGASDRDMTERIKTEQEAYRQLKDDMKGVIDV